MIKVQIIGIIISSLISLAALAVSIVSFIKTNKNASQNTILANGVLEIRLREMISSSKQHLSSCIHNAMMSNINKEDEASQKLASQLVESAFEDLINSYEEACEKYNQNKVNKNSFENLYKNEIINLVKENENKFGMDSNYTEIKKVYNEWNVSEKQASQPSDY